MSANQHFPKTRLTYATGKYTKVVYHKAKVEKRGSRKTLNLIAEEENVQKIETDRQTDRVYLDVYFKEKFMNPVKHQYCF